MPPASTFPRSPRERRRKTALRLLLAFAALVAAFDAWAADVGQAAAFVRDRANAFRESLGLPPLEEEEALARAARDFAQYMARTGRYGHTADGRQPSERAGAAGYEPCIVAENLAFRYRSTGYGDAAELATHFVEGWKESPGHRENMADPAVTETGVGVAQGADGRYFAVQMFGRPKRAAIRFEVENRGGGPIEYRVETRSFTLSPREVGVHLECRPVELAITGRSMPEPATLQAEDGGRYVVAGGRVTKEAALRR